MHSEAKLFIFSSATCSKRSLTSDLYSQKKRFFSFWFLFFFLQCHFVDMLFRNTSHPPLINHVCSWDWMNENIHSNLVSSKHYYRSTWQSIYFMIRRICSYFRQSFLLQLYCPFIYPSCALCAVNRWRTMTTCIGMSVWMSFFFNRVILERNKPFHRFLCKIVSFQLDGPFGGGREQCCA